MRYSSIDTIRVLSGILVILSHYSYFFTSGSLSWASNYVAGLTGRFGVSLFFLISGFLAANSLKKDSLAKYLIKKYIRIEVPYLSTYLTLSCILILFSFFDSAYFSHTPLSNIITNRGDYISFLPVLFALDGIFNSNGFSHMLGISSAFFVGEWFIGTIVFMYVISPIIKKVLNLGNMYLSFLLLCLFSTIVYFAIRDVLYNPFWFVLCRIPEFALGMLIFYKKEQILLNRRNISLSALLWLFISATILFCSYGWLRFGDTFFLFIRFHS